MRDFFKKISRALHWGSVPGCSVCAALLMPVTLMSCEDGFYNEADYVIKTDTTGGGSTSGPVCQGLTKITGNDNCSYADGTFTWTASTNNAMQLFSFKNGTLSSYETMTFTNSDLTPAETTTTYQIVFMTGTTETKAVSFTGAGNQTITLSNELTTEQIAGITSVRLKGACESGSFKITPSNIVLSYKVDNSFAHGVDLSWCTEMEAAGVKFYSKDTNPTDITGNTATPTDIFELMKSSGIDAVRLRVWVNPEKEQTGLSGKAYGKWCDKEDVVAKAERAVAAGIKNIMIDFHYSDYFVDPGTQLKPMAWVNKSYDELKTAIADHTKEVLNALKDKGITPKWVQVGNEITNGMVWEDGRRAGSYSSAASWANFVGMSNAGYDAVKEVCPEAIVIVHVNKGEEDRSSWFTGFKSNGGKFDMIGVSYYPSWSWESQVVQTASRVQALYKTFRVPIMVVETGYSTYDPARAKNVMASLVSALREKNGCRGVFYWEPEVYGGWEHWIAKDGTVHYTVSTPGSKVTSNGAFDEYGRPADALRAIGEQ